MAVMSALRNKMNAVVSIGARAAQVTSDVLEEHAPDLPHICVSPGESLGTQLVARATAQTGDCATVMLQPYDIAEAFDFLCAALPEKRTILLPSHIPTNWEKIYRAPITEFLEKRNRTVIGFSTLSLSTGYTDIDSYLSDADVLLLPEGSGFHDIGYHLSMQSRRSGIPLFAGNTHAVEYYAPLGFGTNLKVLGHQALHYLQRILFEKEQPTSLPLCKLATTRKPLLNKSIADEFGLNGDALAEEFADKIWILDKRE